MKNTPAILAFVLLCLASHTVSFTETAPQDEAARLPDFVKARTELQRALGTRDASGVLRFVDENTTIQGPHGEVTGRAEFRRQLLNNSNSEFWDRAAILLANGSVLSGDCRPQKGSCFVTVPFWALNLPDTVEDAAVMGTNVPVYQRPSVRARQLARLSNAVVRLADDNGAAARASDEWRYIELPAGGTGFVKKLHVFRGTDEALGFRRDDAGRWHISAFTASD